MALKELEKRSMHNVILFYDGVCNLCNGFVRFTIKRDVKKKIIFCPLQDSAAVELRKKSDQEHDITSVIALSQGKYYQHSDVTFLIVRTLGGAWLLLYPLKYIPSGIRDSIYHWVARNRYKWFGKKEACEPITDVERGHFVGEG